MNGEDRDLEALLGGATPRPEPPAQVRARVLAAAEQEWLRHRRRRWYLPLALAAALLVAVAAGLLTTRAPPAVRVQIANGAGLMVDGRREPVGTELLMRPDAELRADAATRLVVAGATELRLREDTRLRWLEPADIELLQGAVYVDTGGRGHMRVTTPHGVVSDIGTRFMVTLDGGTMEVAMREGITSVAALGGTYRATTAGTTGDVVVVGASRVESRTEPLDADRWEWVHALHPGYRQREVLALLQAIADDLGLRLEFASPAVEANVLPLRISDDLTGLGPEQALEMVLEMNDLVREPAPPQTLRIGFLSAPN